MDPLPQDPEARREALERWALEQEPRPEARFHTKVLQRLIGADRLDRGLLKADRTLNRLANRYFDRGLDTEIRAVLPEHALGDRSAYLASAWHVLPRALRSIGVSGSDTFVDFGCGKGRVVHQAARWPFRRVIGVEISPELAETARAVLAARRDQHRCRDVEIVLADVREFHVPDDLTIAYFFQPFGDETFGIVLRNIVDSIDRNPRPVRLIYVWPKSHSTIIATDRFRLVKEQSTSLVNAPLPRLAIYESR